MAALVDTIGRRHLVVFLAADGWADPGLIHARPLAADQLHDRRPDFVPDLFEDQRALPGSERPLQAWTAITGTTDPRWSSVSAHSGVDRHRTPVDSSGLFLLLLRAPWGERPALTLEADGDAVQVQP